MASWLVLAWLAGMIACGAWRLPDYGALFLELRGKPLVERGFIASDEWHDFLARAGRIELRRRLAEARRRGGVGRSNVAAAWAWLVAHEAALPADARIYLNVPTTLYYYYATFFWFPRRIDVAPEPRLIKDGSTLARAAVRVTRSDEEELARRGYTHLVDATPGGLSLIELRPLEARAQ